MRVESRRIQSLVDHAYEYLKEAIITGSYAQGEWIKEEEIASRLEISRPPVRQAFEALVSEGLLTRQPRKGVFVTKITERDIWEIYTLKASLYSLAISLTIDVIKDHEIEMFEKLMQAMEQCFRNKHANIKKYQALNRDFHINVPIKIIQHERLHRTMDILKNQTDRFSYKNLQDESHLKLNFLYHQKIYAAIKKKDKELAQKLIQEHIFLGMNALIKNLSK